jgi:hypothetical protein
MYRDLLSQTQSVRLECLIQANMHSNSNLVKPESIVERAAIFEAYVKEGKVRGQETPEGES